MKLEMANIVAQSYDEGLLELANLIKEHLIPKLREVSTYIKEYTLTKEDWVNLGRPNIEDFVKLVNYHYYHAKVIGSGNDITVRLSWSISNENSYREVLFDTASMLNGNYKYNDSHIQEYIDNVIVPKIEDIKSISRYILLDAVPSKTRRGSYYPEGFIREFDDDYRYDLDDPIFKSFEEQEFVEMKLMWSFLRKYGYEVESYYSKGKLYYKISW